MTQELLHDIRATASCLPIEFNIKKTLVFWTWSFNFILTDISSPRYRSIILLFIVFFLRPLSFFCFYFHFYNSSSVCQIVGLSGVLWALQTFASLCPSYKSYIIFFFFFWFVFFSFVHFISLLQDFLFIYLQHNGHLILFDPARCS